MTEERLSTWLVLCSAGPVSADLYLCIGVRADAAEGIAECASLFTACHGNRAGIRRGAIAPAIRGALAWCIQKHRDSSCGATIGASTVIASNHKAEVIELVVYCPREINR